MNVVFGLRGRFRLGPLALVVLASAVSDARGGERVYRRRVVTAQPVQSVQPVAAPPRSTGTLGTFARTPYLWVRGNGPAGGGYSPLGVSGDQTMVMFGPISSFRSTSAPVLTYSRGYDGRTYLDRGTSFSYPNQPELTPVIYPTHANEYTGFRTSPTPPWWVNGMDWIDQN